MNPWIDMVREFHNRFCVPIQGSPWFPSESRQRLRAALIAEESAEVAQAFSEGGLTDIADGLCDLIYVAIGAALEYGIDLEPIFAEVHRTNMLKVGGSVRRVGKVLKPEGWTPPRIAELLAEQAKKGTP